MLPGGMLYADVEAALPPVVCPYYSLGLDSYLPLREKGIHVRD